MEALLRSELNTQVLEAGSEVEGGIVNAGRARVYTTDTGPVFVKHNTQDASEAMFRCEWESILSIERTHTARVPKPIKLLKHPCGIGSIVVLEYLDGLQSIKDDKIWYILGEQIARMHCHNGDLLQKVKAAAQSVHKVENEVQPITKFGFQYDHYFGPKFFVPANSWEDTYSNYLCRHMIDPLVRSIEKEHGDRKISEQWSQLQLQVDKAFQGLDIVPSLVHGDLFEINVGHVGGEPVIFDPQSFYSFGEFELACDDLPISFHDGYHSIVPRLPGQELRQKIVLYFGNLLLYDTQGLVGPEPLWEPVLKSAEDLLKALAEKA